jgi:hypothetical protein
VKANEGLVVYLSTNLEKVRNNPHPLHYPALLNNNKKAAPLIHENSTF